MNNDDRKAALSAYKQRKVAAGIYAVRCEAAEGVWMGSAPDLSTIQNRIWFTLRQGANPQRSLQDAWDAHGAESFTFEIVAQIAEDEMGHGVDRQLKALLKHWLDALHAIRI